MQSPGKINEFEFVRPEFENATKMPEGIIIAPAYV
jgi:hypothetical protein